MLRETITGSFGGLASGVPPRGRNLLPALAPSYGGVVADEVGGDEREPALPGYDVEHVRSWLRVGEMSPERYVALYAHRWMLGGPLGHRYPDDPEVDAHVQRVKELMRDWDNLDALRRQWLSPDEYTRVQAEIEQMNDPDYNF